MNRTRTPAVADHSATARPGAVTERQGGIQVIARAASVLRALRDHPNGLTLGELAKLLGLPRSTVQRIVDALGDEQLVMAATPVRGVRLGPALLPLAAAARFEVVDFAKSTLEELARDCGETVDLSLLDGDKLVFLDQIAGSHRLKAESGIGLAFELHSSAPGKAMLAAMNPGDLANLRSRLRLTQHTPKTLTHWEALVNELELIQARGYSMDEEENSLGICAVAVALRLPGGDLAAVSIPVPSQRFKTSNAVLADLLVERCRRLQQALGVTG